MTNFDLVTHLAAQQHGVFSVFQLIDSHIPKGSIAHITKRKSVIKVARGVYCLNGYPKTWQNRALTKVLASGRNALLSHESALINAGLLQETFISKRKGVEIDFHITHKRDLRNGTSSKIHRTIYPTIYATTIFINSIPQVQIECALLESARYIPEKIFSYAFDNAIRKELTTTEKMFRLLQEVNTAPGRSKRLIKQYLKAYFCDQAKIAKSESVLETRMIRSLSSIGVEYKLQYEINCHNKMYRLDAAIPEKKIAIEFDGFTYHRDRKTFDDDRTRQNNLVSSGWTVLRFTSEHTIESIINAIVAVLGVESINL